MVVCLGLGDTDHVLYLSLQDAFYVLRHSDVHLAFCALSKLYTDVVMHTALADR